MKQCAAFALLLQMGALEWVVGLRAGDNSLSHDDSSLAHDDSSLAHDDSSLAHDDSSLAHDDDKKYHAKKLSALLKRLDKQNERIGQPVGQEFPTDPPRGHLILDYGDFGLKCVRPDMKRGAMLYVREKRGKCPDDSLFLTYPSRPGYFYIVHYNSLKLLHCNQDRLCALDFVHDIIDTYHNTFEFQADTAGLKNWARIKYEWPVSGAYYLNHPGYGVLKFSDQSSDHNAFSFIDDNNCLEFICKHFHLAMSAYYQVIQCQKECTKHDCCTSPPPVDG